jgi:GLPGLI family protein
MNKPKKNSIIFLLVFNMIHGSIAYAQIKNFAFAKATYEFYHVDDTNKKEEAIEKNMVLYMNETSSIYRNIMDEESKLLLFLAKGGVKENFNILEESASEIIIDGQNHTIERLFDNMYHYSEPKPIIDWEIADEQKIIQNYLAQKASTTFRGRNYTVWFTPEIPLPFGPWKLNGLPGLILDVQDEKNEVRFKFTEFEVLESEDVLIAVPKGFKIKKTSKAEFEKVYQLFAEDPVAFGEASMGIKFSNREEVKNKDSKKYNNPLELKNQL